MGETKIKFCRLCFTALDEEFSYISNLQADMLQIVVPKLNINLTCCPVICKDCVKILDETFAFKSAFLEIEDNLHIYTDNDQKQIDLEKIVGISEVENTDKIPKNKKVCRTCLEVLDNGCFIELGKDNNPLIEVLEKCLPEMDIQLTMEPALCLNCITMLGKKSNFISLCQKNEDKIVRYLKDCKSDEINLLNVVQHVQSREKQVSADMTKTNIHTKESTIDSAVSKTEKIENDKKRIVNTSLANGKVTENFYESNVYVISDNQKTDNSCTLSTSINNNHNGELLKGCIITGIKNTAESFDYQSTRKRYNTRHKNSMIDLTKEPSLSDGEFSTFEPSSGEEYSESEEYTQGWRKQNKRRKMNLNRQPLSQRRCIYCKYCYFKTQEVDAMEKHKFKCRINPYKYIQRLPTALETGILILNPAATNRTTTVETRTVIEQIPDKKKLVPENRNKSVPVKYRNVQIKPLNNTASNKVTQKQAGKSLTVNKVIPARNSVTAERDKSVSATYKHVEVVTLQSVISSLALSIKNPIAAILLAKEKVRTSSENRESEIIRDLVVDVEKEKSVMQNSVSQIESSVFKCDRCGYNIRSTKEVTAMEQYKHVCRINPYVLGQKVSIGMERKVFNPVTYKTPTRTVISVIAGRNEPVSATNRDDGEVVTLCGSSSNAVPAKNSQLAALLLGAKGVETSSNNKASEITKQIDPLVDVEQRKLTVQKNISRMDISVFKCDQCGYNTRSIPLIEQHMRSHFYNRMCGSFSYRQIFYCVKCIRPFYTEFSLFCHHGECADKSKPVAFEVKIGNVIYCTLCLFESDNKTLAFNHTEMCKRKLNGNTAM